jgi:hypothetical protein
MEIQHFNQPVKILIIMRNIEKVYIENAPAGIYTIQVTNKAVCLMESSFSLIAEGFDSSTLSATDFVK